MGCEICIDSAYYNLAMSYSFCGSSFT